MQVKNISIVLSGLESWIAQGYVAETLLEAIWSLLTGNYTSAFQRLNDLNQEGVYCERWLRRARLYEVLANLWFRHPPMFQECDLRGPAMMLWDAWHPEPVRDDKLITPPADASRGDILEVLCIRTLRNIQDDRTKLSKSLFNSEYTAADISSEPSSHSPGPLQVAYEALRLDMPIVASYFLQVAFGYGSIDEVGCFDKWIELRDSGPRAGRSHIFGTQSMMLGDRAVSPPDTTSLAYNLNLGDSLDVFGGDISIHQPGHAIPIEDFGKMLSCSLNLYMLASSQFCDAGSKRGEAVALLKAAAVVQIAKMSSYKLRYQSGQPLSPSDLVTRARELALAAGDLQLEQLSVLYKCLVMKEIDIPMLKGIAAYINSSGNETFGLCIFRSLGVGTVFFQTQDPTNPDVIHDWTLHNVEYNPSSPANLLSPGKLRRDHVEYDWQTSSLIHVTQRTSLAKVHWVSDVCVVETHDTGNHVPRDIAVSLAAFRATQRPSLELMHRRLVHAHPSRVVEACRRVGIRFTTSEIDAFFCESCHLSKSTERISRDHPLPLTSIGDEIHLDLVGVLPLSTKGNRQVLHLMDKYSGYHWVVFLPNHKFATILAAIKKWDTEFYSLTGLKPKVWVSDNAPELIKVFNDPYFEGTRHNTTIAYTPSMNGTIERAGRTIVEGARTQLIDMSLPEELWDYSIDSVTQILNLLPTPSKGNLSPHEIMARELNLAAEREAPHIEHLRTFGCAAYVHKKGPRRPMRSAKMEPRAIKGFLVGYGSLRGHIYYVYLPDRKEVIRCRDVRFREEPHKTVLPPTTGTPNIDEIEHDAAFVEPDIIIQYTIRQKPIEGEKPVTGDPKPDETIVEKAMAPTDTHLMSPPPENLLETTATPRDSITNELNDDEFVASVETMETDHQDPDSLSTIVEEATSQPAESSRPRRASAQRPPGHYRAASGIERDRAAGKIFVSQAKYAKAVLQRFDFDGLSAVKTPMATTDDLPVTWDKNECSLDEQQLYIEQTGCLNFLVAGTRVDMAYTVSKLSQANSGPSKAHLRAIKHLFRYLKGTVYLGIVLGGIPTINELGLYAAADASFADNKPSRVSTGGYVVFLAGAPIAWKSKKQTFVTLSTTEAEFINLTPTAIAVKWIRRCLSQLLGKPITTPTIMFTDSANGYDNVMNPLNEARTRHIDVRYKWIIQEVHTAKSIELRLIKGADMAADGLTKPLVAVKHKEFVRLLGMAEGLD
ncbi:reverse transcriptase domain protein [Colletotrichum truncatum]|uniref:Reverse transcriptase domain protein n=1 Tax=Colletotrichum truncatum TaxID=5467 RepID=A0ACC3Z9D8_COLTU